jgi:hypothetical protein
MQKFVRYGRIFFKLIFRQAEPRSQDEFSTRIRTQTRTRTRTLTNSRFGGNAREWGEGVHTHDLR